MKKLAVLFVSVVLLLCLSSIVMAEKSGDFEFLVLPDGTVEITNYTGIAQHLVIPETLRSLNVSSIGEVAFYMCSELKSITIPNTVTSIGTRAFQCCQNLQSIIIPDTISYMGENPFYICDKLTTISISSNHPYLSLSDGVLFSKPDKRLIHYPRQFSKNTYDIPQGTKIIGDHAFASCWMLTEVNIPNSVISIGHRAFMGCNSLTKITIPDGVAYIGSNAFDSCSALTNIVLSDSVSFIGDRAFALCDVLTSVTIPAGVVSIGENPFAYCEKLQTIIVSPNNSGNTAQSTGKRQQSLCFCGIIETWISR